jgi:hypothetical protein
MLRSNLEIVIMFDAYRVGAAPDFQDEEKPRPMQLGQPPGQVTTQLLSVHFSPLELPSQTVHDSPFTPQLCSDSPYVVLS